MAIKNYNEKRLVRPNKLSSLQILDKIEWRLNKEDLPVRDEKIYIESFEEGINPTIKINIDEKIFENDAIEKKFFNLAIVYENASLKDHFVLYDDLIENSLNFEFEIPYNFSDDVLWNRDATIRLVVYSNQDYQDNDLKFGQIISSKLLKIVLDIESGKLFDPIFLSPEEFEQYHYPRHTSFIVNCSASNLGDDFDSLKDAVRIYIANDLIKACNDLAFISIIKCELIFEILYTGYRGESPYVFEELQEGSILKDITLRVSKELKIDINILINSIKKENTAELKAYIQDFVGMKKLFKGRFI